MIEILKTVGPILIGLGGVVAAATTYLNNRRANVNVSDQNETKRYEVLDAKQEQIAEWGFKAADDANKRADRLAEEARQQVAKLQEQLDALEAKLKEQSDALVTVRQAHARELAALKADYEKQLDLKNRRIYALEDALKGQQGETGTRQRDEDTRLNKRRDEE